MKFPIIMSYKIKLYLSRTTKKSKCYTLGSSSLVRAKFLAKLLYSQTRQSTCMLQGFQDMKPIIDFWKSTLIYMLCFYFQRETFFRLYSYYCQNIPRSERLRETLVDTHLFLQACQLRLGHKLPLAAYLLKPVQRITKYQLLLKVSLKQKST